MNPALYSDATFCARGRCISSLLHTSPLFFKKKNKFKANSYAQILPYAE